jgi:hypothetical protein
MGGTERMAEDRAARSLRENASAPGMVEMDVGREHRLEITQPKSHFSGTPLDRIDGAHRTRVEEHESAVNGRQKGRDHLRGARELQVERLDLGHSTLRKASLTAPESSAESHAEGKRGRGEDGQSPFPLLPSSPFLLPYIPRTPRPFMMDGEGGRP